MTEKDRERAPMAVVAGCFAAGIALQWILRCPAWFLLGLTALGRVALFRGRRRMPSANLLTLAAALLAGGFVAWADGWVRGDDIQRRMQAQPGVVTLVGTLASEPELSRNGRAWMGWFRAEGGTVQVRLPSRAGGFRYGERLQVTGLLRKGRKREAQRLWVQGASGVLSVEDPEGVARLGVRRDPVSRYRRWVARMDGRVELWADRELDAPAAGVLKALLLGKGRELSSELWEDYRRTGTVHVLVVSGLHVGLIGFLVLLLLGVLRVPRVPRYAFLGITLCSYCVLTGLKPPIVRSTLTGLLLCWAAIQGIAAPPLNLLGVAAAGMLAFQPRALADVSFQLSFAAVVGLLAADGWLRSKTRVPGTDQSPVPSARFRNHFVRALAASCGAWVATAPILAWHFRSVTWVAPLANLLVVPWSSLLIASGFLLCLVGLFFPPAAHPFAASFGFLAEGLNRCVGWLAGFQGLFWDW